MRKLFFIYSMCLSVALAHFQALVPNTDNVSEQKDANINFEIAFFHPFEYSYMNMQTPDEVGVVYRGKKELLTKKLETTKTGFSLKYQLKRPADYIFYVKPKTYFEPSEGKFIQHFTKVYVNGFGLEDAWSNTIGLDVELQPLTKPYALYKGNTFQAKALLRGKPLINAEVEVELYNKKGLKAPTESHITQTVLTDERGNFSFTFPKAGWWALNVLIEDGMDTRNGGKMYPIEKGGTIWVKVYEYQ